jgi:heavy metal translocating P-type ATPase
VGSVGVGASARARARWVDAVPRILLVATATGLFAGLVLKWAGSAGSGDLVWTVTGVVGAGYALWSMVDSVRHGRLGVDAIALVALVGAITVGELLAAAVLSVMLATGRWLEGWAARRARRDLESLLDRVPGTAHRYAEGSLSSVPVSEVRPGDVLMVAAGEVVPTDGRLVGSSAVLDESALTGESLPVDRADGDQIRAGVVNAGDPFDLTVESRVDESTYAGIARLVAQAEATPAPFVRLADRYALWFVLVTAALAGAAWVIGGPHRAVDVLVVATPCPLILAAPVALVAGLSRAARIGVVIKDGGVLERLARCSTVCVDKTGTLTTGRPSLVAVATEGALASSEVLRLAASLDQVSPHVLAGALVGGASAQGLELTLPEHTEEVTGHGIRGVVGGRQVCLGRADWVGLSGHPDWAKAVSRQALLEGATTVFVGVDGAPAGALVISDPVRADARRTVRRMRNAGIRRIVMLTGDRQEVASAIAEVVGVDAVRAECTPADKVDAVELERQQAPTIMVGDGINDAPALAVADVGFAMGSRGATASSAAADIVLTVDRLDRVGEAAVLARRTLRIARQSVVAGMGLSLTAMGVALAGGLPAVWGALLQEVIDVTVIANALRAMSPDPSRLRLTDEDIAMGERFRTEHEMIRADIEELRAAADYLGRGQSADTMPRIGDIHRKLVDEVLPHEEAEDRQLYPALDKLLGGVDPTGAMSRAHVEIARQTRQLGVLLDDIGSGAPNPVDVAELQRLMYGLHAILRLHTIQEDESFLSLTDHGT